RSSPPRPRPTTWYRAAICRRNRIELIPTPRQIRANKIFCVRNTHAHRWQRRDDGLPISAAGASEPGLRPRNPSEGGGSRGGRPAPPPKILAARRAAARPALLLGRLLFLLLLDGLHLARGAGRRVLDRPELAVAEVHPLHLGSVERAGAPPAEHRQL